MGILEWFRKRGKTERSVPEDICKLSAQVGFDEEVVELLKREARGSLHRLTGFTEDGSEESAAGVAALIKDMIDFDGIMRLQSSLIPRGYFAFHSRQPHFGPDAIAMIHSANPYDALKIKATNGINYGVETSDIITKLTQWQQQFSFTIVGVDYDLVEIILDTLPSDVDAFAQEVYEFCPDIVEQGTDTVEALVEDIKTKKFLFLWWD